MVYYINFDGMFCSVFDSQILTLIKLLKKENVDIKLINFDRECFYKESIQHTNKKIHYIESILNDKIILIKKVKKGSYLEPIIMNLYVSKLCRNIKSVTDNNIIFHCRGQYSSYIALKVKEKLKDKNIKVISDFRGILDKEYISVYKNRNIFYKITLPLIVNKIKRIEKYIIENANYITCVTNSYRNILANEYLLNYNNIYVIPTCINIEDINFSLKDRIQIRKELNIENKYVIIYSGGGQAWQQPNEIIQTYIKIKKQKKEAYLMILTKDKEIFEPLLKQNKIDSDNYVIISCEYKDIYKYLSCADLGLLIRKDNAVNKVASPTKFAEYISCHVPILLSRNIGDLDYFIKTYKVGLYIDDVNDFNRSIMKINKNNDIYDELIRKNYSWDIQIKKYIQIYNLLRL